MSERDISHWLAKFLIVAYVPLKRLADVVTGTADTIDADPDVNLTRGSVFDTRRRPEYTFDCEAVITAGDGAVGEVFHHPTEIPVYQRTYVIHNPRN